MTTVLYRFVFFLVPAVLIFTTITVIAELNGLVWQAGVAVTLILPFSLAIFWKEVVRTKRNLGNHPDNGTEAKEDAKKELPEKWWKKSLRILARRNARKMWKHIEKARRVVVATVGVIALVALAVSFVGFPAWKAYTNMGTTTGSNDGMITTTNMLIVAVIVAIIGIMLFSFRTFISANAKWLGWTAGAVVVCVIAYCGWYYWPTLSAWVWSGKTERYYQLQMGVTNIPITPGETLVVKSPLGRTGVSMSSTVLLTVEIRGEKKGEEIFIEGVQSNREYPTVWFQIHEVRIRASESGIITFTAKEREERKSSHGWGI